MTLRHKQFLWLTSALACMPGALMAQTAAPPPPQTASASDAQSDAANNGGGVQDIVVTATRRSENLQKVPVNVIALGSSTLESLKIVSTADLPQLAPGLTIVRSGGIVPFIRGVGTATSGFTTEIPVAVYLDGIYQPNASSGLFSFNNIERIEVLKGPQGTLYGRNSTGGLINVITREPGTTPKLDASAAYGNFQSVDLKFYGSTPLSDTLFFNLAAAYSDQGKGYGRNLVTGNDVLKGRSGGVQAKLLWRPGPDTSIQLRGMYGYNKSDFGIGFQLLPGSVAADGTRPAGKYRLQTARDPFSELNQYNVNLKIDQSLGFAHLISLTSYSHARQPLQFTQSGNVGLPVTGQSAVEINQTGSSRTITQEFQLTSSDTTAPLQWVAGAYYFNDNTRVQNEVYGTCVGTTCAGAPLPTRVISYPKTRSYSGYGEGTYHVTDTTHVTLGLRYTSDRKTISGTTVPLPGRPNTPATLPASVVVSPGDPYPGNPNGIDTSSTFNKVTYRAVLAQDFSDNIHGYASLNRGFKSGTYNAVTFNNPASRPEVLDSYAVGLKSELFDRLLRVNVEGFVYDYKDIQLRSTAPPAPVGAALLLNAAKAKVKGVDLDFVLAPTRRFSINGDVEFLDAHYKDFIGGTCVTPRVIGGAVLGGSAAVPCDLSGRRLIQSPKFSFNIGFNYKLDTEFGPLTLVASESHKSSYSQVADGRIKTAAYDLVNASLTWTAANGRYDVQLFGKNLTNAYYYAGAAEAVGGNDVYSSGAPRTYGIQLGIHL